MSLEVKRDFRIVLNFRFCDRLKKKKINERKENWKQTHSHTHMNKYNQTAIRIACTVIRMLCRRSFACANHIVVRHYLIINFMEARKSWLWMKLNAAQNMNIHRHCGNGNCQLNLLFKSIYVCATVHTMDLTSHRQSSLKRITMQHRVITISKRG